MEVMKKILIGVKTPPVMVTDIELGLVNTINNIFPKTPLLFFYWYVNKNVLKACNQYFIADET